jgi:hypothetical protein
LIAAAVAHARRRRADDRAADTVGRAVVAVAALAVVVEAGVAVDAADLHRWPAPLHGMGVITMNHISGTLVRRLTFAGCSLMLMALANLGCTTASQRTFKSPDDAVQSLVTAMRGHDTKAIEAIFGPDSDDILSSGDPVDDQQTQAKFLKAFDEKHRLDPGEGKSMTLVVGKDDWPMPIPIIQDEKGKNWLFDTANGKDEVITRRIGRNELTVIEVCKAICDAQREYAQLDMNGDGLPEYARKFISDEGKKNGLYWPTAEGEPPSPLGEAVAKAQGAGYSVSANPTVHPRPYHGYLYRILTAQGKDAPGGAEDYIIKGRLIGGFAIVAWPVDYGSSGNMTFITNYAGEVYQKDLGEDSDKVGRAMTEYNPDATWSFHRRVAGWRFGP